MRSTFTDVQKEEYESLVMRLGNAGAKNPSSWASSEVTEGLPQFARFLVLKSLFDIAKSTDDNIAMAADFDDELDEKYNTIKDAVGEEKLLSFLSAYSKGIIYNVIGLLDEGNQESDRDKISWTLMKTDENFESTGQIIQGLHEDFLEFEDEIK
ncbi:hypothetical protein [Chryseobacterium sp. ERMR1:04]|uniref:hypothetical protein n=1 Tax=Chryseobacterium sp. ERMR1:04 TaxID=1705393 RepID=UPI0006C8D762|nr:hypothetical protein [Chryseobacterium sp. ERMR1:04]KPH14721.1 hypothetical protein AMQ68_04530 [Chryseobacterium sp. ERMR1:04]